MKRQKQAKNWEIEREGRQTDKQTDRKERDEAIECKRERERERERERGSGVGGGYFEWMTERKLKASILNFFPNCIKQNKQWHHCREWQDFSLFFVIIQDNMKLSNFVDAPQSDQLLCHVLQHKKFKN